MLVSTHDIELAELLDSDGYELHHFREVVDERWSSTPAAHRAADDPQRNHILELYDYPPELIARSLCGAGSSC